MFLTKELREAVTPKRTPSQRPPVMTTDGRFNLSDPKVRLTFARNVETLIGVRYPTDTMRQFLGRVDEPETRLADLRKDKGYLSEADVEKFARQLRVTHETLLSGEGIDEILYRK
jgi:hypothetical protein